MASLYELGWRQGSVLRTVLPGHTLIRAEVGAFDVATSEHDLWVVVSQDCDLHRLNEGDNRPMVELRPLRNTNNPPKLGIRSRLHRFSRFHTEFLDADSLRPMISAASITALLELHPEAREDWLDEEDRSALQTWLGRRYNRPAVPDEYGPLMQRVAKELETCEAELIASVRQVFASIEAGEPPRFSLYALVDDGGNLEAIQHELVEAMLEVPAELGILDGIESHRADTITLQMIESSYEVDASDITWGAGPPQGAH